MPTKQPDVHLNLDVRGLSTSSTLAINEKSRQLELEGRDIFKLGLGQSPFPVPDCVVKSLQKYAGEKDYLQVRGLYQLREAVAEFSNRHGYDAHADRILVGPGSKELLFLLQLVYYGDLLIPAPGWVSYSPQARIVGRHVHWLHTTAENNWLLRPNDLDALCRIDPYKPRVLILNYPSNPTGATYDETQLKALAKIARRYKMIIVSDEIYGLTHYKGEHNSIAKYYPEGTIVSSGLSKWCGAGGWRLGTFTFPPQLEWLMTAMATVASETFTSTSAPIQYAACTAYKKSDEIDEYLAQSRLTLSKIGNWVSDRLNSEGVNTISPQGGFYVFPDFSKYQEKLNNRDIYTSPEFCNTILEETGVAFLPGYDFGKDPTQMFARLAFVDFDGATALKQVKDSTSAADLAPKVIEGVEHILTWLKK